MHLSFDILPQCKLACKRRNVYNKNDKDEKGFPVLNFSMRIKNFYKFLLLMPVKYLSDMPASRNTITGRFKDINYLKLSRNIGQKGFTLIELMIVVAIIGTLASIAIPNYTSYIERAKITKIIAEFKVIETAAYAFKADNNRFPDTLAEAGIGNPVDQWGNPYVYYPMAKVPAGVKIRKDKSLHPVNTDFELYSMGADGKSVAPFTAKASQDDIVRANNGSYIGLVANY